MRYQMTLWIVGVIIILTPSFALPPFINTLLHILLGAFVVVVGIVIHSERSLRGYLTFEEPEKKPITTKKTSETPKKTLKKKIAVSATKTVDTAEITDGIRSLIEETKQKPKKTTEEKGASVSKSEQIEAQKPKTETIIDTVPHPGLSKKEVSKSANSDPSKSTEEKPGADSVPHAAALRDRSWVVSDSEPQS